MNHVEETFIKLLKDKNIELTEHQLKQFNDYFSELVEWNERMNLTGITEREQVYVKHFYDSLSLSFYVPMYSCTTLADIGSGAGFPGIPIKIAFPHIQLSIIDSLNKRIQFLQHLCTKIELTDVRCIHGRAEDLAGQSQYRQQFEIVTARAVARLNILNELCLPFVKKGGLFAAMKGSDPAEEIREASHSMKQLRSVIEEVYSFELPVEGSHRHIIVQRKVGDTPSKYPRKPGVPMKNPII
jgi:16S rRNA (guanine527-N7)-methyltransferase